MGHYRTLVEEDGWIFVCGIALASFRLSKLLISSQIEIDTSEFEFEQNEMSDIYLHQSRMFWFSWYRTNSFMVKIIDSNPK